jgi:hypothetical protein
LRCVEVCGPPDHKVPVPTLPEFAHALTQLASHEARLRRAVDAVACGDAEGYRAAIAEAKLQKFCHLLCRYICSTLYRRICEVVCTRQPVAASDAALDIRADAEVLARVFANKSLSGAIVKAAEALECPQLQKEIETAGFLTNCEIICRIVCIWRCVRVCREFCVEPPPILRGTYAVEEARKFALAARQLAAQPRALSDLAAAVISNNAEAYRAIVDRFGLGTYCWQVCGWVCSEVCYEFCVCVCPSGLFPEFTNIGQLVYGTEIDSTLPATGLTIGGTIDAAALGISGGAYAFYSTLRLNGVLTQTLGGKPLEYAFEYIPVTMASTALAADMSASSSGTTQSITVASSAGFPSSGSFNVVIGSADGGYEIMTVTLVSATTWTVVRGQQGTTAGPAVTGATIVTGVAASGSWTQVPQHMIVSFASSIGMLENPFPTPPTPVYTGDTNAPFTPDGWVQVPQGSNFFPNGTMINLDSTQLPTFTAADETGATAGNSVNHPLPTDLYFGLRMRVRQAGTSSTTIAAASNGQSLPQSTINVASTAGFASSGTIGVVTSAGTVAVTYTGTTPTSFTGCLGGAGTMSAGGAVNSDGSDGGTCSVVAIDNTLYNNVLHHPDWDGGTFNGELAVVQVDIKELQVSNTTIAPASNGQTLPQSTINVVSTAGFPSSGTIAVLTSAGTVPVTYTGTTPTSFTGCSGGAGTMSTGGAVGACADITDSLTVLFTASHPNLGPVSISMTGPGGPYAFTLPTPLPETGDWYGTAAPSGWTLSNLVPCAYLVTLAVTLNLTTGDTGSSNPTRYDQIAFCHN